MKKWLALLSLVLLLAAACGSDPEPTLSPTPEPTPTLTPEPTMPPTMVVNLTEQDFLTLLTIDDIRGVLGANLIIDNVMDFKALGSPGNPPTFDHWEAFYGLAVKESANGAEGGPQIAFNVTDFDSASAASQQYEELKGQGLPSTDPLVGDASVGLEINDGGVGSMFVSMKGDKLIVMYTQSEDQQQLASLDELVRLATIVASRLG